MPAEKADINIIAEYLEAKRSLRDIIRPAEVVLAAVEAKQSKKDLAEAIGAGCPG